MRRKICLVAGARPNFMKISPILDRMRERPDRFDPVFVHTGQHYDDAMSRVFFEDLGMPQPDIYLGVGSGTHAQQTARIMTGFEEVLDGRAFDAVVVVGDVNSTLACSLVAAKAWIPVAHVEAGLRSRDRTMPEEINRIVTDQLSDYCFTTCRDAGDHLISEGVARGKIHFTGNVMIESLIRHQDRFDHSEVHGSLRLQKGGYALVTLHRPSNVDNEAVMSGIFRALEEIRSRIPVVFPVHPRTRSRMEAFNLRPGGKTKNPLILTDPIGYIDFMALEKHAALVLTDSGGIQEETTFWGVPCLTLRHNTERPVTVDVGTNQLVGTDPRRIIDAGMQILDGNIKEGGIPELWDDQVSRRIADILEAEG